MTVKATSHGAVSRFLKMIAVYATIWACVYLIVTRGGIT